VFLHDVYIGCAGDYNSINLINTWVTLKAKKGKLVAQVIEDTWNAYVSQLQESWGETPTGDPQSDLGQAYRRFWEAYGKHRKQ